MVTDMNTNFKLNKIKEIQEAINHKKEYIFHLNEVMTATTAKLTGLPKSRITQRNETLMTEKTTVENEILELQETMNDYQIALNKYLNEEIKDFRVYSVMMLRYVMLKKFSEIQTELHYSESTVFRLHRKGMKILNLKNSTK